MTVACPKTILRLQVLKLLLEAIAMLELSPEEQGVHISTTQPRVPGRSLLCCAAQQIPVPLPSTLLLPRVVLELEFCAVCRYRYTLEELYPMMNALKMRAESYNEWASNVNEALEAKINNKKSEYRTFCL